MPPSPASADPLREQTRTPVPMALVCLALFVALAVAHTWPLASAPGTLSRNDNGDTVLHEWILAWDAHQFLANPLHLFDANIFYPERQTLAYSDPLFVQAVLAAPVIWAGGSPVLAYNLVLLAGFVFTGWAMCLVVHRWTGSWVAGVLSGTLVAFNSFTLTRLPQVQDQHLEFFPFVLLALDRLLVVPRVRQALQLAGWYVLQALTGNYLLVFTAISIVAGVLARPGDWIGERFRPVALAAAGAGALAVAVLAPFLLPYLYVSRSAGLVRSLTETSVYSAHLLDYFASPGRVYLAVWPHSTFIGEWLFPGTTSLVLAGAAIATGVAFKDRRARMALAIGAACFVLSFGPALAPYRWLYQVFPLMTGIRGASRFGQIVLATLAILAGFGLVGVQRLIPRRYVAAVGIAAVLLANIEIWRQRIVYEPYRGTAPIFDALNTIPHHAVVVFFPFYGPAQFHLNTRYMLVAATTFPSMLNGYSGFKPPIFYRHVAALANFPDKGSIQYLRDTGVTYVLVDSRNMRPAAMARLPGFPELTLWQSDGNLNIYLLAN